MAVQQALMRKVGEGVLPTQRNRTTIAVPIAQSDKMPRGQVEGLELSFDPPG
jgi:hypothetical protein